MSEKPLLFILCLLTLNGCSTLGWYGQAVQGQMEIWRTQRPVQTLLTDDTTDTRLAGQLQLAQQMREFAQRELLLPENGSYTRYADLQRDAVLWSVFAAPVDSLELKQWCYPVVGCVSYRGYFDERQAKQLASNLQADGLDTYVGPVPAYSTLGWFTDPLLNTFIDWPEAQLAELIFHELAHQRLYVPGDVVFNESFATAVAEHGVERWLQHRGDTGAWNAFLQQREREQATIHRMLATRKALERLYAADAADWQEQKQQQLQQLRTQLADNAADKDGRDYWRQTELNNARLGAIAVYHDWVPAFRRLLRDKAYDLNAFFQAASTLAELDRDDRAKRLSSLRE